MKREVRFVDLVRPALQRVAIGLARAAKIVGVEGSVAVQDFRKAQRDRRSSLSPHLEPYPTREVLAQVEDRLVARPADPNRPQLADAAHGRGLRSQELRAWWIERDDRRPVTIVVAGAAPARSLAARVVGLTAVDVGQQNRPCGGFPLRVGHDALDAAAAIADLELEPQRE